jgi:predicted ATPase/DNA-binding SARP family transcriptional activator
VLVGVLGPVVVTADDRPVVLGSRRERALLAALALHVGQIVDVDTLGDAVFGAQPPNSVRHALATLVMRVRERLGAEVVETVHGGYRLNGNAVSVDAALFERAVASGDGLHEARAWWRGRPYVELDGWPPAEAARVRLEELLHHAEEELVGQALAAGDPGALVGEVEALVAAAPFRERRWVLLIRALYGAGRQRDALDAFRRARTLLVEELGVEPGPELVAAERAVLLHDESLAFGGVPRPGNVPPSGRALVGRHDDMERVAAAVLEHPTVTLTGPGGVGKTVLALAAARHLRPRFPDGVWQVELAPVSAGTDVPAAVATALGVQHQAGATIVGTLRLALANQQLLIILDNCEHVLDAAAALAGELHQSCAGVRLLATSRERLDVPGEHDMLIRPLPTAGPDSPAVELFMARARRPSLASDQTEFTAAVEICERLDGLPLALELAASRCRGMSAAALAERLRHGLGSLRARHPGDARHATLTDVVQWSFDLLTPTEQVVLARLAVLAGGFDLGAAEAVAGLWDYSSTDVDDAVVALVEKSLADHDGRRYRLLETTRDFARARLRDRTEGLAVADAHLAWFAQFVLAARQGVRGPDEGTWVRRLDDEWANLRAAFRHALELDDPTAAMTLAVALAIEATNRRFDALGWADDVLDRYGRPGHPLLRGVLGAASFARWMRDDLEGAVALAGQAVAQPATPESDAASDLLAEIASFAAQIYSGRLAEALEVARVAMSKPAARQDPWVEQAILYGFVVAADMLGDRAAVAQAAHRGRQLAASSNPSTRAYAWLTEAWGVQQTDPEAAVALATRARDLAASVRNTYVTQLATALTLYWSDPNRDPAAEIANTQETLRAGMLTIAWQRLTLVAIPLTERGFPDLATEILGACRQSPSTATVIETKFQPLCEQLCATLGRAEYDRLSEQGRDRDLPGILRLVQEALLDADRHPRPGPLTVDP